MAVMLPIKKKSYKQPQSPTQIDWSNPITSGLSLMVLGSAQQNLVTTARPTTSANKPTNQAFAKGTARVFTRASSAKDMYSVTGHTGDLTIVFVGCVTTPLAGSQFATVLATSGSSTKRIWFGEQSTSRHILTVQPSGGSAVNIAEVSSTIGEDSVWVIRIAGTTASLWRNGISIGSATIASQNFSDAIEMNLGWTGFLENPNTRVFLQGYWKRALSIDEIVSISNNPWQAFNTPSNVKLPDPESGFKHYKKPRKKQPQNVSVLNRANPLTRELAFLQVGSNPAIDFVSNHKAQLGSNNFPVVSTEGIGVSNNGSSIQATFPHNPIRTSDGVGTGDFTLFFYGAAKNVGARSTPIAQTSAGRTNQVYLIANSDATITPTSGSMAFLTYDSTNNINGLAAAGTIDDNYHFWVGVRSGTTYTLYRDGVVVGSTSGGISSTYSGGEQVTVGGMYSYTTYNSDYPIVLTGAYNRSLNANEVQELTKNPWQLYAPQSTSIFVPVTSGSQIVLPSSITSSEAFGTAIIIPGDVTITVNGIASAEAFGNATVSLVAGNQILDVSGIATSEAFGTAVINTSLTMFPTGIPSGEAFGNHTIVGGEVVLALTGIPSAEAFGTAEIIAGSSTIVPTGIPSGEAFGSALVSPGVVVVFPSGIASAEAFGTPVTLVGDLVIYPNGIPSGEAFGIPTIIGGTPVDTNVVFYVRGFSSFGGRRNA